MPFGHYVFNRLPFGLSNSPAKFQRLVDTVLKDPISFELFVFIDDLIAFSKTAKEHAQRLENVLEDRKSQSEVTPAKCVFAQPRMRYFALSCWRAGSKLAPIK